MKIGVLYGGTSAEREVSLSSGRGVIEALESKGHKVVGIDFTPSKEIIAQISDLEVDIVLLHYTDV